MRLFNKGYKVVLKSPYSSHAEKLSLSLALFGAKVKMVKNHPYDHRIKCWFKDYSEFKHWLAEIVKTNLEFGII